MHPLFRKAWSLTGLLAVALLGLVGATLYVGTGGRRAVRSPRPPSQSERSPPQRAFYYWKTQWTASPRLAQALSAHGIARLYMRFFDVDWDEPARAALPVSPLQFHSPPPAATEIVPVVFIANRVFNRLPAAAVDELADHVFKKIRRMAEVEGIALREVQLDCDWSDGTRAAYFRFLQRLRTQVHAQRLRLSSTLRLHQVKYPQRTGVPPVDRGMVMLYNFGRLSAEPGRSSIFNLPDAERYASYIAAYALPLDISLPMFSWLVHGRDGNVLGLLEKVEAADIEGAGAFRLESAGRYVAERALFFRGQYFMAGDEIVIEETTPAVTQQAAELAARSADPRRPYATTALFDLDERNLSHHAATDIEKVFVTLR